MILGRISPLHLVSRTLFTYPQKRFLDFGPLVWDKVITINKRITYDNSKRIRRKIYRAWQQTQSSRSEVQEPARLRLWDDPAAARAGRPVGRGAGMHHQLATGAELRHLYAAAAGPDGRGAAGVCVRRAGARISQKEVQGSGLINRGLRAPAIWDQGSSLKAQVIHRLQAQATSYPQGSGTSWASSSFQGTGRVGPQALKPSAASARIAEPGKSIGSL